MNLEYSEEAKHLELGNYTHYKGGKYRVLHVGRSCETDTPYEVVVYQDRDNEELVWVQSLERFLEPAGGKTRFAKE